MTKEYSTGMDFLKAHKEDIMIPKLKKVIKNGVLRRAESIIRIPGPKYISSGILARILEAGRNAQERKDRYRDGYVVITLWGHMPIHIVDLKLEGHKLTIQRLHELAKDKYNKDDYCSVFKTIDGTIQGLAKALEDIKQGLRRNGYTNSEIKKTFKFICGFRDTTTGCYLKLDIKEDGHVDAVKFLSVDDKKTNEHATIKIICVDIRANDEIGKLPKEHDEVIGGVCTDVNSIGSNVVERVGALAYRMSPSMKTEDLVYLKHLVTGVLLPNVVSFVEKEETALVQICFTGTSIEQKYLLSQAEPVLKDIRDKVYLASLQIPGEKFSIRNLDFDAVISL